MVRLICEQGDVVSINFDPSLAHEPAGRHYAVVVSPWEINRMSALTLVVPITSRDNGFPLHVPITGAADVAGFAQCEGMRAVDLGARESLGRMTERVGAVDDATLSRLLGTLRVVIGLD